MSNRKPCAEKNHSDVVFDARKKPYARHKAFFINMVKFQYYLTFRWLIFEVFCMIFTKCFF